MKAKNVTAQEMEDALAKVNKQFENNVIFNNFKGA